jgi:hypothetical protein
LAGVWLSLLVSCAVRIPTAPTAAQDGDLVAGDDPYEMAVVGEWATAGRDLWTAVEASEPDLLVLPGNAIERSRTPAWLDLFASIDDLPVIALPGEGERKGDRSLRRYLSAWQGLGVDGLPDPVPWRSFVVAVGPARWRFLVLDADWKALGDEWENQLHWVPKAVAADDAPLVVLLSRPPGALTAPPDDGAATLVELVRSHADPSRTLLAVSGGTGAPELVLPSGRWGDAWLGAGPTAPPVARLPRSAGDLTLAEPLANSLTTRLGARLPDEERLRLEAASAFDGRWPVAGFWWVSIGGAGLSVELRLYDDGTWEPVPALRWTPDGGWTAPSAD